MASPAHPNIRRVLAAALAAATVLPCLGLPMPARADDLKSPAAAQTQGKHPTDRTLADYGIEVWFSKDCTFAPDKLPFKASYSQRAFVIDKVWAWVENDPSLKLENQRVYGADGTTIDVAATLRHINRSLFRGVEAIEAQTGFSTADRSDRQLLRAEAQTAFVEGTIIADPSVDDGGARSNLSTAVILKDPRGMCTQCAHLLRDIQRDGGKMDGVTGGMTADIMGAALNEWRDPGGPHAVTITKFTNDAGASVWLPCSPAGSLEIGGSGKGDWSVIYPTNALTCELFNTKLVNIPSQFEILDGDAQNRHFFISSWEKIYKDAVAADKHHYASAGYEALRTVNLGTNPIIGRTRQDRIEHFAARRPGGEAFERDIRSFLDAQRVARN